VVPRSGGFDRGFEHFVITEIIRAADYARNDFRFFFPGTKDDAEIDLIVERPGRPHFPRARAHVRGRDAAAVVRRRPRGHRSIWNPPASPKKSDQSRQPGMIWIPAAGGLLRPGLP
jgi:hypothetical protein